MTEPTQECYECGRVLPVSAFNLVSHSRPIPRRICRECERQKKAEWRKDHPARKRHPVDAKYYKDEQNKRRASLKHEVIVAYGGRCACCGETNELLLTIDHVYNDGKEHRATMTSDHGETSRKTYQWLKDNGFPKDRFQVLCFNCNWGKAMYGVCPHQMGKEELEDATERSED